MDLNKLIHALLAGDALAARQWVADAARTHLDCSRITEPVGLDAIEGAVAAGMVELLAERAGQVAPEWTGRISAAPFPIFLVRAAESMPRLRRICELEGPWPLRRRRLMAPPEFLTVA